MEEEMPIQHIGKIKEQELVGIPLFVQMSEKKRFVSNLQEANAKIVVIEKMLHLQKKLLNNIFLEKLLQVFIQ